MDGDFTSLSHCVHVDNWKSQQFSSPPVVPITVETFSCATITAYVKATVTARNVKQQWKIRLEHCNLYMFPHVIHPTLMF